MHSKDTETNLKKTEKTREDFLRRIETFCKLLATLIVVIAISLHVARIVKDGSCVFL